MSDIVDLYIEKVNKIGANVSELQNFAQKKADSFKPIVNFRNYIVENIKIINQFKNISDDICKIIDNGNCDTKEIDKIKEVYLLIGQIKTNISNSKHFFTNAQVQEIENLTEDCSKDITFGTINSYKTKLENANNRLQKLRNEHLNEKQRIKEEKERHKKERQLEKQRIEEQNRLLNDELRKLKKQNRNMIIGFVVGFIIGVLLGVRMVQNYNVSELENLILLLSLHSFVGAFFGIGFSSIGITYSKPFDIDISDSLGCLRPLIVILFTAIYIASLPFLIFATPIVGIVRFFKRRSALKSIKSELNNVLNM